MPRITTGAKREAWDRSLLKPPEGWGAWVAQSVRRPTSTQVMISWFVGSSPTLGSELTAQNLEPASDSVSPSLCPFPAHALSLFLKNKDLKKNFF